jgi:hypothetical protein
VSKKKLFYVALFLHVFSYTPLVQD